MTTFRVTQRLLTDRALNHLSGTTRRILKLQDELSTGMRVNDPTDAPLDLRRGVGLRSEIAKDEQFLRNIVEISPHLNETETAAQNALNYFRRARELTVSAAGGAKDISQLTNIALEIDQILEGILDEGNHITNGRYIFAGTRTKSKAFEETRGTDGRIESVIYAGNDADIEVAISENSRVVINQSGDDVFMASQDAFQLLIDLRTDMESNDVNSLQGTRLAELDNVIDGLVSSMVRVGAIHNRFDKVTESTESYILGNQQSMSDALDADYAETLVNLNAENNAYQAALNATARSILPSLLDFVR